MLHLRANLQLSPLAQVGHLFLSPKERGTLAHHQKIRFSSSVRHCVFARHMMLFSSVLLPSSLQ
jgi:hypothetical protein